MTIKLLKDEPSFQPAFELLNIVASDNLDSFLAFEKKYPSFIISSGLQRDHLAESMRLLSLCSLAVVDEEVPYAKVASTLQIEESEVKHKYILFLHFHLS